MNIFDNKVKTLLIGLVLVLFLGRCSSRGNETTIVVNFPNTVWNRFAPVDTVFAIENTKKLYDLKVELSVADGFAHSTIPIEIAITSPNGQENILNKIIVVKDKAGKHIGNVFGNTWTVELPIYQGKEFSKEGEYNIFIQNRSQYYDLIGVESLTFTVIPSRKKKNE